MKEILFNNAAKGLQVSHPILKILQDQSLVLAQTIVKALVANYTAGTVLVLHGCEITVDGQDYEIAAGAVYKDGKIYAVDAKSFTAAIGEVGVWKESITTASAKFGDGASYDVEQEVKLTLSSGASGSGLADAGEEKLLIRRITIPIGDWDMDTDFAVSVTHGISDISKIKSISVMILSDEGEVRNLLSGHAPGGLDFLTVQGYLSITPIDIILARQTDGAAYDNEDFSQLGFNRGFIHIEYGDI